MFVSFFVKQEFFGIDIVKLTLYTDYSLRVLLYLASKPDELGTITEISDFFKISRNHLVKVVHNLGMLGLIITVRGKNGGIKLASSPDKIFISDVVKNTEPDMDILECFNPETDQCVISSSCHLKLVLHDARASFMNVLGQYTLADIARPSKTSKTVKVDISKLKRKKT